MFTVGDSYLRHVLCPKIKQGIPCPVINCLFSHDLTDFEPAKKRIKLQTEKFLNPGVAPTEDVPTPQIIAGDVKSAPVNSESKNGDIALIVPTPISHITVPRSERTTNALAIANTMTGSSTPKRDSISKEFEIANQAQSLDQYRRLIQNYLQPEEPEAKDPEYILPTHLPVSPATIQVRKQNIVAMVQVISQMQPSLKTPKLKAIELEYEIAKTTSKHTYMQSIKRKVYELKNPSKFQKKLKELTDEDFFRELGILVISQDKLAKYGYVVQPPEPVIPKKIQTCRRCKKEFELEKQMIPIHCAFHLGKTAKRDRQRVYECCGAVEGDNENEPCTSYSYHVFSWETSGEKQAFLPYQNTKDIFPNSNGSRFKALGIDCEMGYTTEGFELLRITAMDFFTGEEVLDVLVRPIGTIVDFNTKWSGIAEIKPEALTFEELIKLLGEIMDCNTILIGHGLENDLNAMRLIHTKVVDTAILYPRLKTSPTFRFPLKYLTFKYLNRTIQTGEHDSGEDALAAIDVVKYFIKKDHGL